MLVVVFKRDVRLVAHRTRHQSVNAGGLVLLDQRSREFGLTVFASDYRKLTYMLVLNNICVSKCFVVRLELGSFDQLFVRVESDFVVFSRNLPYQIFVHAAGGVLAHIVQIFLLNLLLVEQLLHFEDDCAVLNLVKVVLFSNFLRGVSYDTVLPGVFHIRALNPHLEESREHFPVEN